MRDQLSTDLMIFSLRGGVTKIYTVAYDVLQHPNLICQKLRVLQQLQKWVSCSIKRMRRCRPHL